MITEIVSFTLPEGTTREDLLAKYRSSVPLWRGNPDLILKTFVFDEATRRGGAVYLWPDIDAAKRAHGDAFRERVRTIYGSEPEFQYLDSLIVIDKWANRVVESSARTVSE